MILSQKGKGLEYEPLQHVRRCETALLLVVLMNLGLVDFLHDVRKSSMAFPFPCREERMRPGEPKGGESP